MLLTVVEQPICDYTSCAGCTETTACNYNIEATIDDGSCEIPDSGFDCDGNCADSGATEYSIEITTASWGSEVSWEYTRWWR